MHARIHTHAHTKSLVFEFFFIQIMPLSNQTLKLTQYQSYLQKRREKGEGTVTEEEEGAVREEREGAVGEEGRLKGPG